MPEKRLVVRPSEILHLERECEHCHATTTLPFVEPKTDFTPDLAKDVLDRCPWCNHRVEEALRAKINTFLRALRDLRATEAPALLLVLKNGDRKDWA
jgi:hypothetical protein